MFVSMWIVGCGQQRDARQMRVRRRWAGVCSVAASLILSHYWQYALLDYVLVDDYDCRRKTPCDVEDPVTGLKPCEVSRCAVTNVVSANVSVALCSRVTNAKWWATTINAVAISLTIAIWNRLGLFVFLFHFNFIFIFYLKKLSFMW